VIVPEPSVDDCRTVALVRELCAALEADGVRQCHWKSNAFLDRSRSAENDLDLLVARADSGRFASVLHRLGFKLVSSRSGSLPGVSSYYGFDEDADRLVHVHAHYQLVVGDDLTKNYRIPLEQAFLDSATRDGEFRVPAPELEFIMLVIRLVLKHRTWDAVVARLARVPSGARHELSYLQERIDHERVDEMLERHLPFVGRQTFARCVRALEPDARRWDGVRAGRHLVAELRSFARRPRAVDVRLKLWRRGLLIASRLISYKPPRKHLAAGGAVIAIVGADGAGKSTAVEALHAWLATNFAVTRVHLGKPPRSLITIVIHGLVLARSAVAVFLGQRRRGDPSPRGYHAWLWVALARDRFLAIRRLRRIATNGELVVCDRWPLPHLSLMDTPRIHRHLKPSDGGRMLRALSALELRYYGALTPPDALIVLLVDPEVAVARKPEEPAEFVRGRWAEMLQVDWAGLGAHVIDAGRPKEEVLARLKSLIWSEV
jgi:thymidylate kinase